MAFPDDFGLTPPQLETRFTGTHLLGNSIGSGFGALKGVYTGGPVIQKKKKVLLSSRHASRIKPVLEETVVNSATQVTRVLR